MSNEDSIAIVGMSCRFPGGANSAEQFWKLLDSGVDAICDVPKDRWDSRKFFDTDKQTVGCTYTNQAGFIRESIWDFDADFFGLSPREAAILDPQQRILLETTWEAFENAGIVLNESERKTMGVYIGAFCFDNAVQQTNPLSRVAIMSNSPTSSSMVMLSNRLSHVFDLQGPSFTVDTACSSSLVATHLACRGIIDGDCETAVVGGVNVMLRPESTILESKGGFLSPDARCKTWDATANGYVRAEGAGVIILRSLSAALANGDEILSIIKSSGVNQDGCTSGITVPNGEAQQDLIEQVMNKAGITASDVAYIEAHGTGTPVGDPIEANALGRSFGQKRGGHSPIWVGSLKANLGHLEAAAGVAGLIKAALCLEHRKVPAQLHLNEVNENINFNELGLQVALGSTQEIVDDGRNHAAVNSFGYGGTNAHVILQRADNTIPKADSSQQLIRDANGDTDERYVFPLSARSHDAVLEFASQLAVQLEQNDDISVADVGHAIACKRHHHFTKYAVVGDGRNQLIHQLHEIAKGERSDAVRISKKRDSRKSAWLYTGMGAQWWGMGQQLYQSDAVFKAAIDRCSSAWQAAGGDCFLPTFARQEDPQFGKPMREPADAQPLNLALQVGLTETLRVNGLMPDAILGHSVGEIAASWAAGSLTLENAFLLTYHRSVIQQKISGLGTMLAFPFPAHVARECIFEFAQDVEIGAYNNSHSVTLSGSKISLQKFVDWALAQGAKATFLQVEVAYHSSQVEPLKEAFYDALSDLSCEAPKLPLYSTVTGEQIIGDIQNVDYWWRNARESVYLHEALNRMSSDDYRCFMEIGPNAVLGSSVISEVEEGQSVSVQKRGSDELVAVQLAIAGWYCAHGSIDWSARFPITDNRIAYPNYPFQREFHWRETVASRNDRLVDELHPLLHERVDSPNNEWQSYLNEQFLPWLPDHKISDSIIFPGAGYAIAALAIAKETERGNTVEDLEFIRPLNPKSQTRLRLNLDESSGKVTITSCQPDEAAQWQHHATAHLVAGEFQSTQGSINLADLEQRCSESVDVDALYDQLSTIGLQYGEHFRCIKKLNSGVNEALVQLECIDANAIDYSLHPALLDASFQALLGIRNNEQVQGTFIPVRIGKLVVIEPVGQQVSAHVEIFEQSTTSLSGNILFFNENGCVVARVDDVRCQRLNDQSAGEMLRKDLYKWNWDETELNPYQGDAVSWFVLDNKDNIGLKIAEAGKSIDSLNVEVISLEDASALVNNAGETVRILDLRALSIEFEKDPTGIHSAAQLLDFVNTLPVTDLAPRLTVVTEAAISIESEEPLPASSTIWGMGRVVASERPELGITLVDVAKNVSTVDSLLVHMQSDSTEEEITFAADGCFSPRLAQFQEAELVFEEKSLNESLQLVLGKPGSIESLYWEPVKRRAPAQGEVEIRVHNTSINFKDLMKVLNMLSAEYIESTFIGEYLGFECAGTVVGVGEGVNDYEIGDEVIAIETSGCFRSYHTVDTGYLFHKPEPFSLANAPALIAYVTPYLGLHHLARARPGETLLIHSASGGVGLAALQIANWLGLKVIATAGSVEKREFLQELGVEHVFDSRSLDFVDGVRELTNGKGVDIVLNSLAGEAARQSMGLLATYGRFLEIGKKDIAEKQSMGLADFDRNLSYIAIDTDRMGAERPEEFRELNAEVLALIEQGDLQPIHHIEMPANDISDAFRLMARAQHIGKISINLFDGSVQARKPTGIEVAQGSKWLVTGGLGGFGLHVAQWLSERGARHLVLLGRTGASRPEAVSAIADFEKRGITVDVKAIDVSDKPAVDQLFSELQQEHTPLQGIVHAAMVLDDAALSEVNEKRLTDVMLPKAVGAWNLHQASLSMPLDAFVLFSSVATLIGNANQGAYVSANTFLEGLGAYRRSRNLAAQVVNWGAITDVGVIAKNRATGDYLESIGIGGLTASRCTDALEYILATGAGQCSYINMNWERWIATAGPVARSGRFAAIVDSFVSGVGVDTPFVAELREMSESDQLESMQNKIVEELAIVLHTGVDKIDLDVSLDNSGVDSLMAVELQIALNTALGSELTAMNLIAQGDSIHKLSLYLIDQVLDTTESTERISDENVEDSVELDVNSTNIDNLSEDELDELLGLV